MGDFIPRRDVLNSERFKGNKHNRINSRRHHRRRVYIPSRGRMQVKGNQRIIAGPVGSWVGVCLEFLCVATIAKKEKKTRHD